MNKILCPNVQSMYNNSKSLIHIVIELLNINNYIQDCSKLDDRWIQMVATAKAGSTTGSSCIRSSSWTHWSKPKCRVVGPSVEIHQGMVMDGAFMAEKMAVFLAMASMASMGKIMENL